MCRSGSKVLGIRVEECIRPDGTTPYKTWFVSLDPQAAAKVVTATLRLGFCLAVIRNAGNRRT